MNKNTEAEAGTQIITLDINGVDYTYTVTRQHFIDFVNNSGGANKPYKAMHNLIAMTVAAEQRDAQAALIATNPSVAMTIAGEVISEYIPDLDIVVKKQNG